jgi:hypothetical protein
VAIATNQQVQTYVDQRIRPRGESERGFVASLQDDKSSIDDVYAACSQGTPTWADNRTDGPPHLLAPADVLSYNAYITAFIQLMTGTGEDQATKSGLVDSIRSNYPTLLKACVRPIGS